MNGFSDVRLAFYSQELDEVQPSAIKAAAADQACVPKGMSRWALYRHRWTSRRALLELTDDQLRDIGIDFQQARAEAMKAFWRR
ncbi:DUF1127 domain-containing protein [Pseudomonas viridiflava]|uniref:YjiS-like domain-containing protein n=1 Tax=Pseudomonas viridiflava TaxID=33069 RepID=A0A3M5P0I5_PSEVI|nr:DUF1127 domain-containing protein [Pseudomonas viridiflava]MBA1231318.1 DUF1127 domain-containing protein [Pseudomonas viridiflava]RMT77775.1 hypothetical protein ALP40_00490 [Pseudomonas viridiflava]